MFLRCFLVLPEEVGTTRIELSRGSLNLKRLKEEAKI
jgi:hypothetical protein